MRLIATLLRSARAPRLGFLDESVLPMRVWPDDLDFNGHMNNGRYLTLMDLGRFDLLTRMGVSRAALKRRWRPMVGSAVIRFRRPLSAFQSFELRSRIVCWDAKWIFVEQRFERRGKEVAAGAIKGLLRGPEGNVPTAELLAAAGSAGAGSPPMPEAIELWQRMEALSGGKAERA